MEYELYGPADFPAFTPAAQKILAAVANNEGITAAQIIEVSGVSKPSAQKHITSLYSKSFIKSRGYAKKLARNNHRQRLYVIDPKAFLPKDEMQSNRRESVFDIRREASAKDNEIQRKIIEEARQFGPFGILVAQATIKPKRRVSNHV